MASAVVERGAVEVASSHGCTVKNPFFRHEPPATGLALSDGYQMLCFAGKSLGSTLAVELAASFTAVRTSAILLTPLAEATAGLGGTPTLAVIGTADPLYPAIVGRIERPGPNVEWRVLAGLDHSLGVPGDVEASLAGVGQVVRACSGFLRQQGGWSA